MLRRPDPALGQEAGTTSLSALLADPPRGGDRRGGAGAGAGGRLHQERAGAVPPVAARAPWPRPRRCRPTCTPRRWSRPASTWSPGSRRPSPSSRPWRPLVLTVGLADDARRRLARAAADRPQAAARLRHGRASWASSSCCSAPAPARPRVAGAALLLAHGLFKVDAVPGRRRHRPRDRHARPAAAVRARPPDARARRRRRRSPPLSMAGVPPLLGLHRPRRRRTRRSCTAARATCWRSPGCSPARC